jgi:uncharacterized protein (TIGR02391 family)
MPRPWPTEAEALAMPVDELALHVLWRLVFTPQQSSPLTSPVNFIARTPPTPSATPGGPVAGGVGGQVLDGSVDLKGPYARAVFESWESLLASGLLARDHEQSGPWYFVTRRGEELARNPNGPARLAAERRIGVALHQRLERRIRRQFLIGEYELAAFAALREVEIRVRELAGAGNAPGDLGVKLVQREFGDGGSLADPGAEAGERQATMALFWGALGVFKNPSSHREVEFDDPTEASEVVLLADLLLRILDRVAARSEAQDD